MHRTTSATHPTPSLHLHQSSASFPKPILLMLPSTCFPPFHLRSVLFTFSIHFMYHFIHQNIFFRSSQNMTTPPRTIRPVRWYGHVLKSLIFDGHTFEITYDHVMFCPEYDFKLHISQRFILQAFLNLFCVNKEPKLKLCETYGRVPRSVGMSLPQTAWIELITRPIHRAPHGARSPTVFDEETRCWLNTIPPSI